MSVASFTVGCMRRLFTKRQVTHWGPTLRDRRERRRRHRRLTALPGSLDASYGLVDEALVAKYEELL
jgi:hypothetical protein